MRCTTTATGTTSASSSARASCSGADPEQALGGGGEEGGGSRRGPGRCVLLPQPVVDHVPAPRQPERPAARSASARTPPHTAATCRRSGRTRRHDVETPASGPATPVGSVTASEQGGLGGEPTLVSSR